MTSQKQLPMQHTTIRQGWFTETETLWPGQKFSLALENFSDRSILFHAESSFQDILVFKSAQHGNVLCLDGVIQLTQRDEFAYHEMLVHVPLCSLPVPPRRVLVVGGGDAYALRALLAYDSIQEIVVVEIDPMVMQVARDYFEAGPALSDPRVTVIHADAATYLRDFASEAASPSQYFDVILSDSSDPVGPAESLFQPAFYEHLYQSLHPSHGIVCVQAECFWIHLDLISDLMACCRQMGFQSVEYASTLVPTYPCGQIGFVVASRGGSCQWPRRDPPLSLRWYNREVHAASFVLPTFVADRLYRSDEGGDAPLSSPSISRHRYRQGDSDDCVCHGLVQLWKSLFPRENSALILTQPVVNGCANGNGHTEDR